MSMKHTPGIWRQHADDPLVITAGGETIAKVDPRRRLAIPGQVEADAHLIAAAPEMLRELGRLSDLLEHVLATPGYGHDDNSREEAEAHVAAARAVLAKAEA